MTRGRAGPPRLVPAWLDRVAQWSWRLLVALGLVAMVVSIFMVVPMVVVPIVVATILAATLDPLVRLLVRRGRQRGQAAAISVGGGFLVITLLVVVTFVALVGQMGAIESVGLDRRRGGEQRGWR